jgi:hypothetical protein
MDITDDNYRAPVRNYLTQPIDPNNQEIIESRDADDNLSYTRNPNYRPPNYVAPTPVAAPVAAVPPPKTPDQIMAERILSTGQTNVAGAGAAGTAFQNADVGMNPYNTAQLGLMGQLQQQAIGQGPSAAQQMMQNAQQQNVAQAYALAASQNGMNSALAQRMAQQQAVAGNQQIAGQGMAMRAQEQLNAQQQLAGITGQGMNQQLARGGQFLQQQQQLGELAAKYEQMGLSQTQALLMAQLEGRKIDAGIAQNRYTNETSLLGGLLSGAAGIGAAYLTKNPAAAAPAAAVVGNIIK